MPNWERLRDDLIQKETRRKYLQCSSSGGREEDSVALATRGKKGKPKAHWPTGAGTSTNTGTGTQQGKNKRKDCSKVKCWNCHKMEHFAINCPEKRRKGKVKNAVASTIQMILLLGSSRSFPWWQSTQVAQLLHSSGI